MKCVKLNKLMYKISMFDVSALSLLLASFVRYLKDILYLFSFYNTYTPRVCWGVQVHNLLAENLGTRHFSDFRMEYF